VKWVKPVAVPAAIAIASAGLLCLVGPGTDARRLAADRDHELARLRAVLPAFSNEPAREAIETDLGGGRKAILYPARGPGGEFLGLAVELPAPPGYGGAVTLLVGMDAGLKVIDYTVLPGHAETPGLGTRVFEDAWRAQFRGKGLVEPGRTWKVQRDDPDGLVDQVTGATITSRSIARGVELALMTAESRIREIPGAVVEEPETDQASRPVVTEEDFLRENLDRVLPAHDNRPAGKPVPIDLGGGKNAILYPARLAGALVGVAVEMESPPGYGGPIRLLVGAGMDGAITGVAIFPGHKENPGYGDRVEDEAWLAGFVGKTLGSGVWKPRAEDPAGVVDAVSGATVSSRAVVAGVGDALAVIGEYKVKVE